MSNGSRRPSILPHRRILDLLRALPAVDCQNRLLRVSDRELAFSLLYMDNGERERVLSLIGGGKARRVSSELSRIERSRTDTRQYEIATSIVIRTLEGGSTEAARSYYRPSRRAPRG